ncbi:hypothetical protein KUTeg_018111 [Tegillarca granosa]|uniref:Uncharacterized protein n=1 Tax=Tegillarca granosa TaxID=220873 RepID=A0ABQ9EMN6_TEGGR|nr:hypothetical protein KUTeg_018111 [Tegillarca granosa]
MSLSASSIQISLYVCIVLYMLSFAQGFPSQILENYSDVDFEPRDDPNAYQDTYLLIPEDSYHGFIKKRVVNKRLSINDLLKKLQAIYGRDEIYHNGRSTYMRFGPGGRR